MDNDLIDFLKDVESADSEEAVYQAYIKAVKRHGFEIVNYAFLQSAEDGTTRTSYLTNFNKDWLDYYYNNNFQNHDYLVKAVLEKTTIPIIHDNDDPDGLHLLTKENKEIFDIAAEVGAERAVVIPFGDLKGDSSGAMLIGTNLLSTTEFKKIIENKGSTLFAMTHIAHQKLKNKYMNVQIFQNIQLSNRQKETVKYLALGLSNKEIGFRMKINPATVSFHLKGILKKMNAKTTREILPIAIALNLVDL